MQAGTAPRHLLFWFLLFLFLRPLCVLSPRRSDTHRTRIDDGLSQVFSAMPHDEEQGAALGILSPKPVERFFQIGVWHRSNGFARVVKRIFQRSDDLGFVSG